MPWTSRDGRLKLRQNWSKAMLGILGVRLELAGDLPGPGSLLISNHISWLDVFVINAALPAAFISKAEVRDWPIIGWLATRNDTVFLRRGSRGHAKIVNGEIRALLEKNAHVAIFPEGTTTDGSHLLAFHGALLQPAIEAQADIQPLALAYRLPDGRFTRAPAYDGDLSLLDSMRAIIASPAIVARVRFTAPLSTRDTPDRKALCSAARQAIQAALTD